MEDAGDNLANYLARRRPRSPSARCPTMSRHNNMADMIEQHTQQDGHKIWGFVMYRTTYSSDEQWARFLERLDVETTRRFEDDNGLDVLENRRATIMDDEAQFNNMDSHAIRKHFSAWICQAYSQEQGLDIQDRGLPTGRSPRYRFAIQIDDESLASILEDLDDSFESYEKKSRGWVKFIDKNWFPEEDSDSDSPARSQYEAIEGVVEKDVGWMKQNWRVVHTGLYQYASDLNYWPTAYRRPPEFAISP